MLIAQCALPHVGQLDCAFRARVHEPVTAAGVELCRRDNLRELLHVRRLDVDDVEALVLDVQVPQVYAEIVAADEGLAVAVYRDAVDVVGVRVGVGSTRYGSHDGIVVRKARELELARVAEEGMSGSRSATTADQGSRCQVMR